jgi:glycosyltransferase involved in cell wall biosynthesis
MPERRALMIAHHFPPAGGSGSIRALAFARYLPEYGWTPTVLTPAADWAMNRDDALLGEVPMGLRVLRTHSWEAQSKPRIGSMTAQTPRTNRLRSHAGHLKRFPDAHVGWLPFALAAARQQAYEVAYSSSGPFTSHLVGLLLKRLTRRPWVAELRDGWYHWNRAIFPDYPIWRDRLERRLEAAALKMADRVVLVTERMAAAFRCQYATTLPSTHFAVVPNGFDPAQFREQAREKHASWEVLHAGALYYGRSLDAFLQAVKRTIAADPSFANAFRLELIGTLDAAAKRDIARSELTEKIQVRGQVTHEHAIKLMGGADALLLVANTTPGAEATVPGKLYEYLAVGRPVIAVAPCESATADVLRGTRGGWLAEAENPDAIACVLKEAYRERELSANQAAIARYDRRRLTGDLARIFDEVLSGAARRL